MMNVPITAIVRRPAQVNASGAPMAGITNRPMRIAMNQKTIDPLIAKRMGL